MCETSEIAFVAICVKSSYTMPGLKCPHTSTRCSSEQWPSTGVRMHPIDNNLHAASCQRDNAS